MMKKVIAAVLALAMVFSLAACAKTSDETKAAETKAAETEAAETEAAETEAATGEKVQMRIMKIGGGDVTTESELIENIVKNFNENNEWNAEFTFEYYDDSTYKSKVPTLMTQDNMADVFFTWDYGYLGDYVEAGKVYCLDDALAADPDWAGRFNAGMFESTTYDGKVYAVPTTYVYYPTFYNKEIFAEYGLEVPTTWDEFTNVCDTLLENGVTPFTMGGADAWIWGQFYLRILAGVAGSDAYNGIRYETGAFNSDAFIEAGEVLQELVNKGYFLENNTGITGDEAQVKFYDGEAAMYHMGSWVTGGIVENMGDENVGVFYLPAYYEKNAKTNLGAADMCWAVPECCDNKDAAVALIKEFSTPENQSDLFIKASDFLATNVQVDSTKIDKICQNILEITGDMDPIGPFDVLLGQDVGNEFNMTAVAIVSGSDVKESLDYLQEYWEDARE